MFFAGIDIGASTAKAVILGDEDVMGYSIRPTGHDVTLAAEKVMEEAILNAGQSVSIRSLEYIVSTGYARNTIKFSNKAITEIICHAKGAHFVIPAARFVIDMGGQDSKAIELDPQGNIINFIMNDKCAAGTGRFLEVMAGVLEVDSLEQIGTLAVISENPCSISSTCTVFAETEVVALRGMGKSREDLVAGVHKAVSARVAAMALNLKIRPDAVFTGGVAKNKGIKKFLEKDIGIELHIPQEPQIIGALGAALFARAECGK